MKTLFTSYFKELGLTIEVNKEALDWIGDGENIHIFATKFTSPYTGYYVTLKVDGKVIPLWQEEFTNQKEAIIAIQRALDTLEAEKQKEQITNLVETLEVEENIEETIEGYSVAVYGCDDNGDYESDFGRLPHYVIELCQPVESYEKAMENAEKIDKYLMNNKYDFYRVEIWEAWEDGDIVESFYKLG